MDTFFGPYFHFCLEPAMETWAKAFLTPSLRVHDPNHTHSLASFQWAGLSDQRVLQLTESCLQIQKWCPYKARGVVPEPVCANTVFILILRMIQSNARNRPYVIPNVKRIVDGSPDTTPLFWVAVYGALVSSPNQIFRVRPADSSKNRVWTLSLRKLGQVYIWRAVNWAIVGVNYIISNQQRLLWRQKNCKLAIYDDA